jgi:hypothetical protein
MDDIELSGPTPGDVRQRRQAARVALNGDNTPRSLGKERTRQSARTGADFDNRSASQRAAGTGDAGGQIEVEQEVLA